MRGVVVGMRKVAMGNVAMTVTVTVPSHRDEIYASMANLGFK
jgi:hypothetical protein